MSEIPVFIKILRGELNTDFPIGCECGMLVVTNPQMTDLKCMNELCPVHKAFEVVNVLSKLGIQCNVGNARAEEILYAAKCKSHLDVFDPQVLENVKTQSGMMYSSLSVVTAIKRIQEGLRIVNENGGISVATYMYCFRFDSMGETVCNNLFSQFSRIEEFYDKYMTDMTTARNFIASRLNQSPWTDTVTHIYQTLLKYKDSIYHYTKFFKFCEITNTDEISVCITNSITRSVDDNGNRFQPRDTFVEYLRKKYKRNIRYTNSFTNSTHFLICDLDVNSSKSRKAKSLQRIDPKALRLKETDPTIQLGNRMVTSDEFENMIKNNLI